LGGKAEAGAISATPNEIIDQDFVVGTGLYNPFGLCEWICVYTYYPFMACI
jgi:hypothetical protein